MKVFWDGKLLLNWPAPESVPMSLVKCPSLSNVFAVLRSATAAHALLP
jgi:hypothetical protein